MVWRYKLKILFPKFRNKYFLGGRCELWRWPERKRFSRKSCSPVYSSLGFSGTLWPGQTNMYRSGSCNNTLLNIDRRFFRSEFQRYELIFIDSAQSSESKCKFWAVPISKRIWIRIQNPDLNFWYYIAEIMTRQQWNTI